MSRRITRRQFLAGAGASGAAILFGCQLPASSDRSLVERAYLPTVSNNIDVDKYNVITIMLDTLRYDHVAANGNTWIQTPNLNSFASQAVVFDNVFMGGFPTAINRSELFSGRWMYPFMNWGDFPEDEVHVASQLSQAGYLTGAVFDTWLLKDDGHTFERGFGSWEWIRGQLLDRYRVAPVQPILPADLSKLRNGAADITQYLRNVSGRQGEGDYFAAQTMNTAIAWLERNHAAGPFYLHVDSFDPHEPWDPPKAYVDLYDPGYHGEEVIYPAYAPPDYLSAAELKHMRALYAGEVTLVDRWLGELLAAIGRLGLVENTMVVVLSDHGLMLGEHDAVGKTQETPVRRAYPLWQELAHVVLMVRMPGVAPRRSQALAQTPDVTATLLNVAGVGQPGNSNGVSLIPLLLTPPGQPEPVLRSAAVSARSLMVPLNQQPRITVGDGEWTLLHGGGHASSSLYHVSEDPQQQTDLLGQECAVARGLHDYLVTLLDSLDIPEKLVAPWRPTPC